MLIVMKRHKQKEMDYIMTQSQAKMLKKFNLREKLAKKFSRESYIKSFGINRSPWFGMRLMNLNAEK